MEEEISTRGTLTGGHQGHLFKDIQRHGTAFHVIDNAGSGGYCYYSIRRSRAFVYSCNRKTSYRNHISI